MKSEKERVGLIQTYLPVALLRVTDDAIIRIKTMPRSLHKNNNIKSVLQTNITRREAVIRTGTTKAKKIMHQIITSHGGPLPKTESGTHRVTLTPLYNVPYP